jgi:hypothetical protein
MLASIHTTGRHAKTCSTAYLSQIAIISSVLYSFWWLFHLPFGVTLWLRNSNGRARGALFFGRSFICSLHLFRCCTVVFSPKKINKIKKRRVRWNKALTTCITVKRSRLHIEPPTHYLPTYLNPYPLIHTSPNHRPNHSCIQLPIYLRTHPSLPPTTSTTQTPTHTRYILQLQQVTKCAQFFRNNARDTICPKWQ